MKRIKKLFWVAAVFAAVFGIAGCDNPSGSSDNNSGGSGGLVSNSGDSSSSGGASGNAQEQAVAVYESVGQEMDMENGRKVKYVGLLTFFKDKTCTMDSYAKSGTYSLLWGQSQGTYEGDPTKDGPVTATMTKLLMLDESSSDEDKMTPENWHKLKLKEQDISSKETITISGGGKKATWGGTEYARK